MSDGTSLVDSFSHIIHLNGFLNEMDLKNTETTDMVVLQHSSVKS